MRVRFITAVFVLVSFLCGAFLVTNSFAESKERAEIKKAIDLKKARWTSRDTKISQITSNERKKRLGSYTPNPPSQDKILQITSAAVPGKLDWRNYNGNNYVTPVKEQGSCSDCWAFASAAALESNKLISNNTPGVFIDLSEQTLNSCSGAGSCSGGYIDAAANFLRDIGLPQETCFPYTATDGICSVSCSDWLINPYKISGWYKVNPTIESIKYALYNYGPLVSLMAVNTDFYYYSAGIYNYTWGSMEGYHATLIVGYDDAEQYFIIKSSWGEDWGEAGYGKIAYSEIASATQFGFWTIAYETTIPAGFPTLNNIPRDPSNPNPNTTIKNGNNNAQLSILTGSVKDSSGNAVSGAEIKIGKYRTVSNAGGIYVFSSLPAGSYIATVSKDGYSTVSESLTVTPSETVTKDFVISSTDDKKDKDKEKGISGGIKGAGWWGVEPRSVTVNHTDAEAYFTERKIQLAAKTSRASSAAAPMAGDAQASTDIEQLARGLRYNPKLIYDYVHNRIDYVPYYGALKSPTLTYLDESGNDFDQAALMVDLLRASMGKDANIIITDVNFVYGKMALTVAELANWFGVDATGQSIRGVVDQGRLLCDTFSDSAGPSDTIYMRRVWVSATINGNSYVFDPAFKEYTYTSKIDIGTAMGFSRDDLINAVESGATVTDTSVQKLNDSGLRGKLNGYTSNLINTIKSQYPNKDIKEIIGGRNIKQTYIENYPTLLPHSPSSTTTWASIPLEYTTQMTIRTCPTLNSIKQCDNTTGYANYTTSTTGLTGQTIWLDFHKDINTPDAGSLHIGSDTPIDAGTQCSGSRSFYVDVKIDHPYVNDTSADQQSATLIRSCPTEDWYDVTEYVYAIPYNFGGMSEKLIKKQKEKLELAINNSNSLAAAAEALNMIGLEYLMESEMSSRIVAALTDTVYMPHHRMLLAARSALPHGSWFSESTYIDSIFWLSSVFSKIQDHAVGELTDGEKKFYKTNYSIASALEQGTMVQLQSGLEPVSTTKLLGTAGTSLETAQKVLVATKDTWPAISISPTLLGYSAAEISAITAFINPTNTNHSCYGGCTFFLPAKKISDWVTFIAKRYYTDNANNGHINLNFIVSDAHGGFGTLTKELQPSVVAQNTPDEYTPPGKGTVNMVDGSYNYKHTSLQLGGGKTGLSFTHTYDSSNKNVGTMGRGGSHNYDVSLKSKTIPRLILGQRQPLDAAALIAGIYTSLNIIMDNDTTDNVKTWVETAMVSNWISDQILNNTVIVQKGNDTLEYVKKPDGSYISPPGDTTTLTHGFPCYKITDRYGTTYEFWDDIKLGRIVDIDGNTVTFAYNTDTPKTLASVSNNFGRSLTFGYTTDTNKKISSVSDNANRTVYYYYDTAGNLNKYKDPEAKEWTYGYDDHNRMTTLTTPAVTGYLSGITMATNTYDSLGRVISEKVPIQGTSATATYNYYYSDYRNAVEDPQGHSVAHYFDNKMRENAMEDPLGKKTIQEYDGQNHVVKVTDALGNTTISEYDGNNNLTKTTTALGYWVTNTYDSQFRLTDTTDNDNANHNSHFTYDTKHHLLSARDPLGNTVSATYKANGLKETTTDANGTMTTIAYDSYGNIKTTTVGSHPAITYNYDSASKYDIRGIRSGLTDQVGSTTSFVYNKLGQLTGKTDPLNKMSSSVYDNAGRLISKTDRKNQTITYTYAANGKLAQITYPTGTPVAYTYNNLNQLVSMQDSLGTTTYNSYDAAGRLTSMTDPHGFTISYTYDELGNVKTLSYPGNKTVTYTYDSLNRLKTVTNWLNQSATYADYDAAGRLPGFTNFNGTQTTYSYDNASRLTAINNQKSDNSVIANYTFTFDGNGNRTSIEQDEPYAPAIGDGNADYTYNTQKNRLLSTSTEGSFGYDDEGQLQTGYSASYTFDYEHRLKTIGSTQFNYDGGGKRLEAIRGGVTTRYIYSPSGTLLAEADSNNSITKYYVYGNGLLATVTPTDQTYCYHFNGIGSTVAVTDSNQAVVNQYSYDAFGNIANQQEAFAQTFKYVGQAGVMTEPNGFYYMRARYYDPKVGRFISEDPSGFGGGDVNLMAYVGNNPVNGTDPSGLFLDFLSSPLPTMSDNLLDSISIANGLNIGVDASWTVGFLTMNAGSSGFSVSVSSMPLDLSINVSCNNPWNQPSGNKGNDINLSSQIPKTPISVQSNTDLTRFNVSLGVPSFTSPINADTSLENFTQSVIAPKAAYVTSVVAPTAEYIGKAVGGAIQSFANWLSK